MPLEPENECPDCGAWKGEDFELCRDCAEAKKEERERPVEVRYIVRVEETPKAVLFKLSPGFMGRRLWIPKSQILEENLTERALCVPRWWAEDNGLAYQD